MNTTSNSSAATEPNEIARRFGDDEHQVETPMYERDLATTLEEVRSFVTQLLEPAKELAIEQRKAREREVEAVTWREFAIEAMRAGFSAPLPADVAPADGVRFSADSAERYADEMTARWRARYAKAAT